MVVPNGLGLHDPGLSGFRCVRAVGGALCPVECCVEGFPGGAESNDTPTSTPPIPLSCSINHISTSRAPARRVTFGSSVPLGVEVQRNIVFSLLKHSTATRPSPYTSESTLSIGGYPWVNLLPRFALLGKGTFSGTKGHLGLPPTFRTRYATLTLFFFLKRSVAGNCVFSIPPLSRTLFIEPPNPWCLVGQVTPRLVSPVPPL